MSSVEFARRKLTFDESLTVSRKKTDLNRSPRRLDFGESDPVVLQNCPDLLPKRTDPTPVNGPSSPPWSKNDRITFTTEHRWQLEALFRRNIFPKRAEKTALAERLGVPPEKVMTWFNNRRHRWRKELKKSLLGSSAPGYRFTLLGSSLFPTSSKRYLNGNVGFSRSTEFQTNRFPSTPYPVGVPLPPASTRISRPPPPKQIPWQQVYPRFPAAEARQVPQQHPVTHSQSSAACLYPSRHSIPLSNAVSNPPEVRQASAPETKSLADDFPFLHSVANDLPHIFGNLDEEKAEKGQERPLTPSLEPLTELESIRDSISAASDQTDETSSQSSVTSEESANGEHVQSRTYNSCCFGNDSDFSRGFVSNGRTFRFFRQD